MKTPNQLLRSSAVPRFAARKNEIRDFLLKTYGPLLTKDDMVKVFGFPSSSAFDRYCQRGHMNLNLVRLPSRRGVFAHASDVAEYLAKIPRESVGQESEKRTMPKEPNR